MKKPHFFLHTAQVRSSFGINIVFQATHLSMFSIERMWNANIINSNNNHNSNNNVPNS